MENIIKAMLTNWLAKTPTAAKFLQYIAIALTVITGLPEIINSLLEQFDLQLLKDLSILADKYVATITGLLAFILQFTKTEEK
jgi:hypothetical protein